MRFEMLGGRYDDNGTTRVFRKGKRTIVTSDKPLDEMFKNSFRRLEEVSKVSKDHRDTPDHSGGQVMDDLASQKKKKVRDREEIEDPTARRKKANRPRIIGRAQELDQRRSVLREGEASEDEMEEDEDLEALDEELGAAEEEEEAKEREEAGEDEPADEEEDESEEEEEEPEPEPVPVKTTKKKKMKAKSKKTK